MATPTKVTAAATARSVMELTPSQKAASSDWLPEHPVTMATEQAEAVKTTFLSSGAPAYMVSGAVAGIMEHCVMYPVDSIKTRMQCLVPHKNAVYSSLFDAMRKIRADEGIFRTWRGINAVLMGAGPAHALYFSTYEGTKMLLGNRGTGGHYPLQNAAAGVVATLFHDGIMNPVEVVKQRMQMYNSPYSNIRQCATAIFRAEGIPAFYRSFTTSLTMNLPFQCTHFVTYEFIRETLNPAGGYDPKTHLLAGATAGGLAAAITTPLDVAKTLLNTQEERVVCCLEQPRTEVDARRFMRGMLRALVHIYAVRGVAGFVQGMRARVVYQMPACAISWSVYEFFKQYFKMQISDEEMIDLTM